MLTGRAHPLPVVMLAFSIALGMSGCVAPTPDPTPSTSAAPSASPLFDSDEQALAAATEAYAAYLAASDLVGQGGWQNLEAVAAFVNTEALAADTAVADRYREAGYVQSGATSFDSVRVQQVQSNEVVAYLCLDATQVDVVDATGVSIVNRSQARRGEFLISFTPVLNDPERLLVGRSEVWSGADFC